MTSDGKSSRCLWQGELKIEILFSAFLIKYKMSGAIKYFRKTKW
jgi:hypothetical protein